MKKSLLLPSLFFSTLSCTNDDDVVKEQPVFEKIEIIEKKKKNRKHTRTRKA